MCILNCSQDGTLNKPTSQITKSNGNLKATIGSNSTLMSGSETSSERNTTQELGLNSNTNEDPTNFVSSLCHSSMPRMLAFNTTSTNYYEHRRLNTTWSISSASDGSLDGSSENDSTSKEQKTNIAITFNKKPKIIPKNQNQLQGRRLVCSRCNLEIKSKPEINRQFCNVLI